jgi:hypothetical protein
VAASTASQDVGPVSEPGSGFEPGSRIFSEVDGSPKLMNLVHRSNQVPYLIRFGAWVGETALGELLGRPVAVCEHAA